MEPFTLHDVSCLPSAKAQADQVISEPDSVAVIEGAPSGNALIVLLRFRDSGNTIQKKSCVKFDARDLPKIAEGPGQANRFCDISTGETSEGIPLVIESHRSYLNDPQGSEIVCKRFYRHVLICNDLSHKNIVQFQGVFNSSKFPYACVFESVGDEDLVQYLIGRPDISRVKLLTEVAHGLQYIHEMNIVHGDIRGVNIRIDELGSARISGFASATIALESGIVLEDVDESVEPHASRWCSPEILHPDSFGLAKARLTKASDIYAFGMLAYEIFAGQAPFHDSIDAAIIASVVITDERPSRPTHHQLSDHLWGKIQECWQREPSQRPTIPEIVAFLRSV